MLLKKNLKVKVVLWYVFISKRMMPVGHTNNVQRERALVLYAIFTGLTIDVGKLIFGQLSMCP